MEWLHLEAALQEVDGRTFPAELAEELDVATAAKMARLWHRTKAPPSRELQVKVPPIERGSCSDIAG